jgi:hypothetical protein
MTVGVKPVAIAALLVGSAALPAVAALAVARLGRR